MQATSQTLSDRQFAECVKAMTGYSGVGYRDTETGETVHGLDNLDRVDYELLMLNYVYPKRPRSVRIADSGANHLNQLADHLKPAKVRDYERAESTIAHTTFKRVEEIYLRLRAEDFEFLDENEFNLTVDAMEDRFTSYVENRDKLIPVAMWRLMDRTERIITGLTLDSLRVSETSDDTYKLIYFDYKIYRQPIKSRNDAWIHGIERGLANSREYRARIGDPSFVSMEDREPLKVVGGMYS